MNFVNKMQFWQTYCEIIELKDKVVKDFFRMKTRLLALVLKSLQLSGKGR